MIKYSTISCRESTIVFSDARDVEHFKEKFTILGEDRVSRAIFPYDVSIRYCDEGSVVLTPSERFTYDSIYHMVSHMMHHGFSFRPEVLSSTLEQACSLDMGDMVILERAGKPSFVTKVNQDAVLLYPISVRYLSLEEGSESGRFADLLRSSVSLDVAIDPKNRCITIEIDGSSCDVLRSMVNTALELGIIDPENREHTLSQLVNVAFLDFTNRELEIVRSIAGYSSAHPLSKYKGLAKSMENILRSLADKVVDSSILSQLEDALEGKGEFSAAPPLLTKGLARLNRNFGMQLQNIIGRSHSAT